MPRVSVISIFYNEERYIIEAIDSILAQDFSDFELLLVDDGSSDASSTIARDYAAARPDKIQYFEHPAHENRGMSASRNLGLERARGEFVAFIDADDRWRSHKLREQVELLDEMPNVDAVGGSVNYWASHSGGKDRVVPTGHTQHRPIPPGEASINFYPLGRRHAPSMSDLMFRRSSIIKVDGFEDAFRGAYEDQAFLAKFYLESTLYLTTAVWSDYRLHPASCMATVQRNGTYANARRAFLRWFESYLVGSAFRDDKAVRRALARAVLRSEEPELRTKVRNLSPPFIVAMIRAGKSSIRQLRPFLAPGPAILMYHRIADESFDPWCLAVSPQNFSEQLDWIARHRTPLPLDEFARLHRQGKLPRDSIALTFDDGYACNAEVAVPLLEQSNIPATIFLPVELIERGEECWWDELERIVLSDRIDILRLDGAEIILGKRRFDDEKWASGEPPRTARQHAYRDLWALLYGRKPRDLEAGMNQLREQAGSPEAPRQSHRLLTPKEVRGMSSEVVQFGSHALSHPSLPMLSADEKAREICGSMDRCTELTGAKPQSFAYPYGNFDAESQRLIEEAGFLCACKAEGWFVTARTNPFELPRIFVGDWNASRLARELGRP